MLEPVVGLGNRRRIECVRLYDIRTGGDVFAVNLANDVRLREHKQVVVALEILTFPIRKALSAVVGFLQFVLLDHGAHRAVQDEDALGEKVAKGFFGG